VPELVDEMEHIEMLSRAKIQITPNRLNYLRDCSTLLAVGICVVILIFYRYDVITYSNSEVDIGPYIDANAEFVTWILGYI
jgi:hypothetical protein